MVELKYTVLITQEKNTANNAWLKSDFQKTKNSKKVLLAEL